MVGGDTCSHILLQIGARHSRGMSVDGFAIPLCRGDLFHDFAVFEDDAWIVHHF